MTGKAPNDEDPEISTMGELLLRVYEDGGQYAVYDWVKANHPEWPWAACEPCEDETPTWDDVCAVCWTARDDD
jgi:hypothetical protein